MPTMPLHANRAIPSQGDASTWHAFMPAWYPILYTMVDIKLLTAKWRSIEPWPQQACGDCWPEFAKQSITKSPTIDKNKNKNSTKHCPRLRLYGSGIKVLYNMPSVNEQSGNNCNNLKERKFSFDWHSYRRMMQSGNSILPTSTLRLYRMAQVYRHRECFYMRMPIFSAHP